MAIVEFRRQMVDAVRAVQAGAAAIGTGAARVSPEVCAFQAIVPKATDWRVFPCTHVWNEARPALEPSYSTPART